MATPIDFDQRPGHLRFLQAGTRVLERTNRILTQDPTLTVETPEFGFAPAWTDGRTISIRARDWEHDYQTDEAVARLLGLNYHELAHVIHTPRDGSYAMRLIVRQSRVTGLPLRKVLNLADDQRIETLFTAKYETAGAFFTQAVLDLIIDGEASPDTTWVLICGRRYLPTKLRQVSRKLYRGDAAEWEALMAEYLLIDWAYDADRGVELLVAMAEHLQANQVDPPEGCGTSPAQGEPQDADEEREQVAQDIEDEQAEAEEPEAEEGDDDDTPADDPEGEDEEADDTEAEEAEEGDDTQGPGEPGDEEEAEDESEGESEGEVAEPGDDQEAEEGDDAEGESGDTDAEAEGESDADTEGESDQGDPDWDEALEDAKGEADEQAQDEADRVESQIADLIEEADAEMGANLPRHLERVPVTPAATSLAYELEGVLAELRMAVDPGWVTHQPEGKINARRYMTRKPWDGMDEVFDLWSAGAEEALDIEIAILVDGSGSMEGPYGQPKTKAPAFGAAEAAWALKTALHRHGIPVAVMAFESANSSKLIYGEHEEADETWMPQPYVGGSTHPAQALIEVGRHFNYSPHRHKVLVVLTDGEWDGMGADDRRLYGNWGNLVAAIDAETRVLLRYGNHMGRSRADLGFDEYHDIHEIEALADAVRETIVESVMRSGVQEAG